MFSVIYYQLFRTRLFRIPRYFELIVLSLHLKSTPLFRTCQKQSTYIRAQLETYCILFELVMFDSRAVSFTIDKSIKKNKNNTTFKDISMQQHLLIYPTYNYCIFISSVSFFILYCILLSILLHCIYFCFWLGFEIFELFLMWFESSLSIHVADLCLTNQVQSSVDPRCWFVSE